MQEIPKGVGQPQPTYDYETSWNHLIPEIKAPWANYEPETTKEREERLKKLREENDRENRNK